MIFPCSSAGRVVGAVVAFWLGAVVPLVCVPGLTSRHDHGSHVIFAAPGVHAHGHGRAHHGHRHRPAPGDRWGDVGGAAEDTGQPATAARVFEIPADLPAAQGCEPTPTASPRSDAGRAVAAAFDPPPPWHPPRPV